MSYYPFSLNFTHETYKVTFLQTVSIEIKYNDEHETFEAFHDLLKGCFGIDLPEERYSVKSATSLRLRKDDNLQRIKFAPGYVEYVVSGQGYKNFQSSIQPFLRCMVSFFKAIDTSATDLIIEKINIWPVANDVAVDEKKFTDIIFSKELLEYEKMTDGPISWFEITDTENYNTLIVKHGFLSEGQDATSSPQRLILDTAIQHSEPIPSDKLCSVADELNHILHGAYLWSVTQDVKDAMQQTPQDLSER